MSALFTARDGAVIFDGKPVPEVRAIAVRQHLVAVALDRNASDQRAQAFWRLAGQVRAALTASRDQRLTLSNTAGRSETTVDSSQDGAVYVLGRESR